MSFLDDFDGPQLVEIARDLDQRDGTLASLAVARMLEGWCEKHAGKLARPDSNTCQIPLNVLYFQLGIRYTINYAIMADKETRDEAAHLLKKAKAKEQHG